jgi:hypothetical protein
MLAAALAKLRELASPAEADPRPGQPAGKEPPAKEASPFDTPTGNSPF